jgi:hypothetical protein
MHSSKVLPPQVQTAQFVFPVGSRPSPLSVGVMQSKLTLRRPNSCVPADFRIQWPRAFQRLQLLRFAPGRQPEHQTTPLSFRNRTQQLFLLNHDLLEVAGIVSVKVPGSFPNCPLPFFLDQNAHSLNVKV